MSSIPNVGGTTRPVPIFEGQVDPRVERRQLDDEHPRRQQERALRPPVGRVHRAYERAGHSRDRRREAMSVGQLMTRRVVVLPADGVIAEAAAVLRQRRVHHIPVVDREGHPIGIVSERDLLVLPEAQSGLTVAEIMSRDLVAARPEDDLRSAARSMMERHVGSVVVTDATGVLVGILTTRDIVRAVADGAPLELWA